MKNSEFAPRSVLVYVGGDLVGDGVMKLPFLRALRGACPDARITWLSGKYKSAYAHELAPLVDGLLDEVIEEAGFDRAMRELLQRPMPDRHFDLILDTQRGVATSLALRRIAHDRFVSGAGNFLLSDVRPPRPYRRPPAMIRQMLDLLSLGLGRELGAGPAPRLDEATMAAAARALPDGAVYVGFVPGAGGRHKCWPLESFAATAAAESAKGRVPVFILGPGDESWIAGLAAAVPNAIFPSSDAPGRPGVSRSVPFTIAVASRLSAAVANDSGGGHMVAAADVPLISLFGPTSPEKFAPTASRLTLLRAQDFGDEDMSAIPVEAVTRAIDEILR